MKKTNKVKMGPLGTPLGNPLGYFNSLKGKKPEPKQTLRKAEDGFEMNGYGEDPNKYVMNKTNIFGKNKFKEISKKKFDRVSNRYSNQKGSESFGTNESVGQQVISGRNKKNYVSRVDEVREAELEGRYPDYKTISEQEPIFPPERRKKSNTPMLDSMYPSDEKLTGLTQEQLRAKGVSARSAAVQGTGARGVADTISKVQNTYPPSTIRKKGGAVKTKKRK